MENIGWIANSGLFLLAGATITLAMFEERWLAMIIGISRSDATALACGSRAAWFRSSGPAISSANLWIMTSAACAVR